MNKVDICNIGNLIILESKNIIVKILYKLSTENDYLINTQFIAKYRNVKKWFENYFIADGSRVKFEVLRDILVPKYKP